MNLNYGNYDSSKNLGADFKTLITTISRKLPKATLIDRLFRSDFSDLNQAEKDTKKWIYNSLDRIKFLEDKIVSLKEVLSLPSLTSSERIQVETQLKVLLNEFAGEKIPIDKVWSLLKDKKILMVMDKEKNISKEFKDLIFRIDFQTKRLGFLLNKDQSNVQKSINHIKESIKSIEQGLALKESLRNSDLSNALQQALLKNKRDLEIIKNTLNNSDSVDDNTDLLKQIDVSIHRITSRLTPKNRIEEGIKDIEREIEKLKPITDKNISHIYELAIDAYALKTELNKGACVIKNELENILSAIKSSDVTFISNVIKLHQRFSKKNLDQLPLHEQKLFKQGLEHLKNHLEQISTKQQDEQNLIDSYNSTRSKIDRKKPLIEQIDLLIDLEKKFEAIRTYRIANSDPTKWNQVDALKTPIDDFLKLRHVFFGSPTFATMHNTIQLGDTIKDFKQKLIQKEAELKKEYFNIVNQIQNIQRLSPNKQKKKNLSIALEQKYEEIRKFKTEIYDFIEPNSELSQILRDEPLKMPEKTVSTTTPLKKQGTSYIEQQKQMRIEPDVIANELLYQIINQPNQASALEILLNEFSGDRNSEYLNQIVIIACNRVVDHSPHIRSDTQKVQLENEAVGLMDLLHQSDLIQYVHPKNLNPHVLQLAFGPKEMNKLTKDQISYFVDIDTLEIREDFKQRNEPYFFINEPNLFIEAAKKHI